MKLKTLAVALVVAMAVPVSANAAVGKRSLGFFGDLINTEDNNTYLVNVAYGQFIQENIEINGDFTYVYTEAGDTTVQQIGVIGDYFFPANGDLLPYAGGGGDYATMDSGGSSDSFLEFLIEAGVRKPISETADIDAKIRHTEPTDSDFDARNELMFGLRIKF